MTARVSDQIINTNFTSVEKACVAKDRFLSHEEDPPPSLPKTTARFQLHNRLNFAFWETRHQKAYSAMQGIFYANRTLFFPNMVQRKEIFLKCHGPTLFLYVSENCWQMHDFCFKKRWWFWLKGGERVRISHWNSKKLKHHPWTHTHTSTYTLSQPISSVNILHHLRRSNKDGWQLQSSYNRW